MLLISSAGILLLAVSRLGLSSYGPPIPREYMIRNAEHVILAEVMTLDSTVTARGIGRTDIERYERLLLTPSDIFVTLRIVEEFKGHFTEETVTLWINERYWDRMKWLAISGLLKPGETAILLISTSPHNGLNVIYANSGLYAVEGGMVQLHEFETIQWQKVDEPPGESGCISRDGENHHGRRMRPEKT